MDQRRTRAEVVGAGWPAGKVDRIIRMIVSSQFKRRLPLIAKISSRTVGIDFRYPRDWGT